MKDNNNEYYTYYTDTKKLVYEDERNGKIVKTKILVKKDSKDIAGVTDSADGTNDDVYFIIYKKDHLAGIKGKSYFLTCTFFSGFQTKSGEIHIADQTIPVELQFEY